MHKALPPSTAPKHFPECRQNCEIAAAPEQVVVNLQRCDAVMTMVGMACALHLGELQ